MEDGHRSQNWNAEEGQFPLTNDPRRLVIYGPRSPFFLDQISRAGQDFSQKIRKQTKQGDITEEDGFGVFLTL